MPTRLLPELFSDVLTYYLNGLFDAMYSNWSGPDDTAMELFEVQASKVQKLNRYITEYKEGVLKIAHVSQNYRVQSLALFKVHFDVVDSSYVEIRHEIQLCRNVERLLPCCCVPELKTLELREEKMGYLWGEMRVLECAFEQDSPEMQEMHEPKLERD